MSSAKQQTQVAAQLYTLREFMKTPDDIEESLKRVKEMGYHAVQLSGLGPIEPQRLKEILDENELTAAATHVGYSRMKDDPEGVIAEHKLLQCELTAIGGMPGEYREHQSSWAAFAREASDVARRLAEGGLTWAYHNHSFELVRFDGRTGLEILFDESDPEVFNSELDTYWLQYGGADPAAWVRRMKGRAPIVHLKDMAVQGRDPIMAEVGEGNLNWPAILAACEEAGVRWYAVEQDRCQRDPFESLAISLRNITSWGLS